ncbi:10021_t:CDS:1 [Funneliformis mosseae]|uniref:10021_t:CDS:1 n=1 Tax=Funneliformis mosseae TaxID=27381 RepID=A0A9N9G407_FUNMO|nr:10021_t:CDS:1 [Funneliformis mosseae]
MVEDPVWESSMVDTINPNVFRRLLMNLTVLLLGIKIFRGLFTEINAHCMSSKNKNLTSHDDVKDNAELIYQKLSRMEMPPGEPWSEYQIGLFKGKKDKDGIFEQFRLGPTPSATDYGKKIRDALYKIGEVQKAFNR